MYAAVFAMLKTASMQYLV